MKRWRWVVGYEGLYEVSDQGRVRSVDRVETTRLGVTKRRKGRILQTWAITRYGHLALRLSKNGVKTNLQVHRLVLLAWIGPCPEGMECCHEDGNPTNNTLSNLRWRTHSSNIIDMFEHGNGHNRCVRRSDGVEFGSLKDAAESVDISFSSIWKACNGHRRTAGGYGWEYIND